MTEAQYKQFLSVVQALSEEIRPFAEVLEQIGKALAESEFGVFMRLYQSMATTGKPPA